MKHAILEISGCDRTGKTTLRNALYDSFSPGRYNMHFLLERGIFDGIVLDDYFGRTIDNVVNDRWSFLKNSHDYYAVIFLYASQDTIESRQQEEIDNGYLDNSSYRRMQIDVNRMLSLYFDYIDHLKKMTEIDVYEYNTDEMSTKQIVEDILKKENDIEDR